MKLKNYLKNKCNITSTHIIFITAAFLLVFGNLTFFVNVFGVYPVNRENIGFLISLVLLFTGANTLLLSLVCFRYTLKPVIITILIVSSIAAYYMDSYNIIIDSSMIHNIVKTDVNEALDLFSFRLVLYVVVIGILPSYLVYKVKVTHKPFMKETLSRIKLILFTLVCMVALVWVSSDYYASFFREHKVLRSYANPGYYIYSTTKYIRNYFKTDLAALKPIGGDAIIPVSDSQRELIIFVAGETARADRFSLNGYEKETNPLLEKEEVVSLTNFWSCGTSTAISLPCMFSIYKADEFSNSKAQTTENVLDVLSKAGVNVLWLDNNSGSKGVADRVLYKSYNSKEVNPICDAECRDVGMLEAVQPYIDEHTQGDILIVLHQMGTHGPAYYKRYPAEFRKFSPVCQTNELKDCTREELDNAYDNAILYTDYFLSRVINLLKQNKDQFETAMFYVSDHGESLGENGLYLHGLPDFIAPDAQRHVPAILWFGMNFDDVNIDIIAAERDKRYTHDNIFHTLLGFMEINTSIYDKSMDILHNS